jgi:hypothetical protein
VVYINNEILFSPKEEGNHVICRKMDGTGSHHIKQNKPDSERQISHAFCHTQKLKYKTTPQQPPQPPPKTKDLKVEELLGKEKGAVERREGRGQVALLPRFASDHNPLTFSSRVAEIIGVSHHASM